MKILITNDDGISSKLILLLYNKIKKLGHEVVICAPVENNSCISESIRYWEYNDNKLTKVDENIYSHPGTPTDGINYYLREFERPDLVISGPNIGLNASYDVQYSGTIGAASEAINLGIKSVAISTDVNANIDTIDKGLDYILNKIFENNLFSLDYIYSFNIPSEIKLDKIVICPLNKGRDFNEGFDASLYQDLGEHYIKNIGKNTDLYYLKKGIMTVTPILVDRTDYKNMPKIAHFFDK
jgi:5'-nucleotidase